MGMRGRQVLLRVELPLGLPLIFAGIRTAAVFVVSTATIAAIAGGGGLGDIIVNQASYRLAGVVGAALCVAALASWRPLLLTLRRPEAVSRTSLTPRFRRLPEHPPIPSEGRGVIRKHTRRAAKAAFGVSFGVAIVLGGTATGATRHRRRRRRSRSARRTSPRSTCSASSTSRRSRRRASRSSYKGSIGSSELTDTALTSGKINLYPEYTGVIVLDLASQVAEDRGRDLRRRRRSRRSAASRCSTRRRSSTPTRSRVLKSTATKYGAEDDLRPEEGARRSRYAGYPECRRGSPACSG